MSIAVLLKYKVFFFLVVFIQAVTATESTAGRFVVQRFIAVHNYLLYIFQLFIYLMSMVIPVSIMWKKAQIYSHLQYKYLQ